MALNNKTRSPNPNAASEASKPKKDVSDSDLGQALRSVYQRAVDEDIPPEMLDLLGKLD